MRNETGTTERQYDGLDRVVSFTDVNGNLGSGRGFDSNIAESHNYDYSDFLDDTISEIVFIREDINE